MARWYKRGGVYYLDWYEDGERNRYPCEAVSDEEAEAQRVALEERLGRGQRVKIAGSPTLRDLLAKFLDDKRAKRERGTHDTYEKHARRFMAHLPMGLRACDITADHIDAYMAKRLKDPGRPGRKVGKITVNKERVTLSTLFRWALRRRYVERNPVEAVDPFSVRHEEKQPCPPEVYRAFIDAVRRDVADEAIRADFREARERMADIAEVLWETGLRAGEACRLRPEDVDAKAWTMRVRSAPNKGPATLPVPRAVRAIFKRRLRLGRPFVFGLAEGQNPYRALYVVWDNWQRLHPEHRAAHFHALRHGFSTRCEAAGLDPRVTQALMRHATLKMTGRYSHRGLDVLRDALDVLASGDHGSPRGGRRPSRRPRR